MKYPNSTLKHTPTLMSSNSSIFPLASVRRTRSSTWHTPGGRRGDNDMDARQPRQTNYKRKSDSWSVNLTLEEVRDAQQPFCLRQVHRSLAGLLPLSTKANQRTGPCSNTYTCTFCTMYKQRRATRYFPLGCEVRRSSDALDFLFGFVSPT